MGVEWQSKESMYESFQATDHERRRRMMKREWEVRVSEFTSEIISKLSAISKNSSGELGLPEYGEAWKFLGRGGNEDEIKKAFDSVDIDGSGLVAIEEFVMSLMGKKAMNFGALADLEILVKLLDETSGLLAGLQADLGDAKMSVEARAKRNAEPQERTEHMKKDMGESMVNVIGKMLSIMGQNPEDILTEEEINKL